MALRLRRGTDAERLLVTPLQGEPIFTTDTKRLYVGDGNTIGGVLVTGDTSNTEVLADATPQLGGDLDLNSNNIIGTGNISIDGTITATGNISLGDSDADTIDVGGLINTNLRPAIDGAYNIGSAIRRWNNIYAESAQIDGEITAQNLVVGNIIGADSTVYLNTDAGEFTGTFTGNFNGNITGDSLGLHTGRVSDTSPEGSTIQNFTSSNATITGGSITGIDIGTPATGVNIEAQTLNIQGLATGNLQGNVNGNLNGDVKGSVFAEDSSVIVDAINGNLSASDVACRSVTLTEGFSGLQSSSTLNDLQITDGYMQLITNATVNDDFSVLDIYNFQNNTASSALLFVRGRGTGFATAQPAVVGDEIQQLLFAGISADQSPGNSVSITASVDSAGTVGNGVVPGNLQIKTTNDSGTEVVALNLNRDGEITVADNTLTAGVASGEVDDSAAVNYLQITVGGTTYAMPLFAIRP